MSIKIYTAYRIPKNKLDDFTSLARKSTWARILEKIDGWIPLVTQEQIDEYLKSNAPNTSADWANDEKNKLQLAWRVLEKRMIKDSESNWRLIYDCDALFRFWMDGHFIYIIPFGDTGIPDSPPSWVEDYSYWDSTDKPNDITQRQWNARYKKWSKLCLGDWRSTQYQHIIAKFSQDYADSFWVIEKHLGFWD